LNEKTFQKKTSVVIYIPEWDWIIGVSAYNEDFMQGLEEIRLNILIVCSIAIICGSIVAYLFIIKISKPILELEQISQKAASGNLEVDTKSIENASGEVGSLAKSIGLMIQKLKIKIEELNSFNTSLEKLNHELNFLDKQKDEFISLTAHELKTPLTSIKGFTQLLQDRSILLDFNMSNHYLDLINKNTDRLYNLVLDIVDSSRLSLGKLKLNIAEIDTKKMFTDIKENMTLSITSKGLTAEFFIEENIPNINADYERTMQILRNLLSNSTKFTEKGSISLKIFKEGDFVKFEIKDTGQGIPKENFKSIFSRFYQVDSSMTRKVGGSGLGLSICKGLVEGMNGKIGFDSELGKGSTFYFTIPIIKSQQNLQLEINSKDSK
jgi:signal transduction histidine kinase